MKRKFTEKREARRGPAKTMMNVWYRMSVAERRARGIQAADSTEYDERHGLILSLPSVAKKRKAVTRRVSA